MADQLPDAQNTDEKAPKKRNFWKWAGYAALAAGVIASGGAIGAFFGAGALYGTIGALLGGGAIAMTRSYGSSLGISKWFLNVKPGANGQLSGPQKLKRLIGLGLKFAPAIAMGALAVAFPVAGIAAGVALFVGAAGVVNFRDGITPGGPYETANPVARQRLENIKKIHDQFPEIFNMRMDVSRELMSGQNLTSKLTSNSQLLNKDEVFLINEMVEANNRRIAGILNPEERQKAMDAIPTIGEFLLMGPQDKSVHYLKATGKELDPKRLTGLERTAMNKYMSRMNIEGKNNGLLGNYGYKVNDFVMTLGKPVAKLFGMVAPKPEAGLIDWAAKQRESVVIKSRIASGTASEADLAKAATNPSMQPPKAQVQAQPQQPSAQGQVHTASPAESKPLNTDVEALAKIIAGALATVLAAQSAQAATPRQPANESSYGAVAQPSVSVAPASREKAKGGGAGTASGGGNSSSGKSGSGSSTQRVKKEKPARPAFDVAATGVATGATAPTVNVNERGAAVTSFTSAQGHKVNVTYNTTGVPTPPKSTPPGLGNG